MADTSPLIRCNTAGRRRLDVLRYELQAIRSVLENTQGCLQRAAEPLYGLHEFTDFRSYLHRKLSFVLDNHKSEQDNGLAFAVVRTIIADGESTSPARECLWAPVKKCLEDKLWPSLVERFADNHSASLGAAGVGLGDRALAIWSTKHGKFIGKSSGWVSGDWFHCCRWQDSLQDAVKVLPIEHGQQHGEVLHGSKVHIKVGQEHYLYQPTFRFSNESGPMIGCYPGNVDYKACWEIRHATHGLDAAWAKDLTSLPIVCGDRVTLLFKGWWTDQMLPLFCYKAWQHLHFRYGLRLNGQWSEECDLLLMDFEEAKALVV